MTDSEGQMNGRSVYSIGLVDPMLFCSLTTVVSASGTDTNDGGDLLPGE